MSRRISLPEDPENVAITDAEIVTSVRQRAGLLGRNDGPSDAHIVQGVRGFAREFTYWYGRVLEEAIPKFHNLVTSRINPMIRGMEYEGLPLAEVVRGLVGDYARRNYVTAGGWAIEQLAIAGSPRLHKSSAAGIDAEWHEAGATPVSNLYVIKSGTVTRNSDILKALKSHGQEAQKRLIQTNKKAVVRVHYVVTAGRRKSGYEDGVYRPSSAEFWAQAFALENEKEAVDLALAMSQQAGELLKQSDAATHIRGMESAVAAYLANPASPAQVDWEFLAQFNMLKDPELEKDHKNRLARAKAAVMKAGHKWPSGRKSKDSELASDLANAAASLSPEGSVDLLELLPQQE
ncbi:PmeII family type II restriction endonuclease [Micromonospora sp. CA-240977]|uniref:PmeII family type II restriction endonuclease n=1 Tax=Micromonospora sp. CA-240977 TaxID=3239957 RepID=UPI003D8F408D